MDGSTPQVVSTAQPVDRNDEVANDPQRLTSDKTNVSTQFRWAPTDSSYLSPSALPLTRVSRAWERKPQSPFSRRRLKVGKVWKRTLANSVVSSTGLSGKRTASFSPTKTAVKKIRLDAGHGVGVRWDVLGLTDRKIVTRSSNVAGDEGLVQLSDEVDFDAGHLAENQADMNVERDSVRSYAPELAANGWEDVDAALDAVDVDRAIENGEEVVEITQHELPTHADILLPSKEHNSPEWDKVVTGRDADLMSTAVQPAPDKNVNEAVMAKHEDKYNTPETLRDDATPLRVHSAGEAEIEIEIDFEDAGRTGTQDPGSSNFEIIALPLALPLPEGFVSPAKARRRRPISEVRRSQGTRRQTLPTNFAAAKPTLSSIRKDGPSPVIEEGHVVKPVVTVDALDTEPEPESNVQDTNTSLSTHQLLLDTGDAIADEDAWEDIEDDSANDSDKLRSHGVDQLEYNGQETLCLERVEERMTGMTQRCENKRSNASESASATAQQVLDRQQETSHINQSTDPSVPLETDDIVPESEHSDLDATDHGTAMAAESADASGLKGSVTSGRSEQETVDTALLESAASSTSETELLIQAVPSELVLSPRGVPVPQRSETPSVSTLLRPSGAAGERCQLHPRRPLRRQSSSPKKGSAVAPSIEKKSHLVAFTPVKLFKYPQQTRETQPEQQASPFSLPVIQNAFSHVVNHDLPNSTSIFDDLELGESSEQQAPKFTRSSSAPPESPQMSPRKLRQPRISDDTALLQAFLNRAAETRSKSERRLSATKRESLENRRDSDSVRRALASSPMISNMAPTQLELDVLKEMDPNSPSPRKQQGPSANDRDARPERQMTSDSHKILPELEDDSLQQDSPTRGDKRQRRSSRQKKQPEMLAATIFSSSGNENMTAQPTSSSISIRSNSGAGIVVKRTEAQELALQTKANTRKNKGTAVHPSIRLNRLAAEVAGMDKVDDDCMADILRSDNKKAKRKSVVWAETLVAYQDSVVDIDTARVDAEVEDQVTSTAFESLSELDANEESSKPRLKALKPRLTPRPAVADDCAPDEPSEIDSLAASNDTLTLSCIAGEFDDGTMNPKAVPRKRRKSRIATPAKARDSGTLLLASTSDENPGMVQKPVAEPFVAADTGTSNQMPTTTSSIPTPTARRVPASRLPAPASSTRDKERDAHVAASSALIASPPKKKLRLRPSTRQQQQSSLQPPSTNSSANRVSPPLAFTFGGSTAPKFEMPHSSESETVGLASPAKKARGLFGVRDGRDVDSNRKESLMMSGLGSPAKKRGRPARG